jgi:hypothetical protein
MRHYSNARLLPVDHGSQASEQFRIIEVEPGAQHGEFLFVGAVEIAADMLRPLPAGGTGICARAPLTRLDG